MKGKIAEVFDSVQGEGIFLGERQLFVRLFGCNLHCSFCDTPLDRYTEYEPQELLGELLLYPDEYHAVAFTGGEPLLQKDFLKEALRLCREHGFRNYLETNGTLPDALAEVIDEVDTIAMDIKLPSSSGHSGLWDTHKKFLKIAKKKETFVKVVICEETVDEDVRSTLSLLKEINPAVVLVFQPHGHQKSVELHDKLDRFRGLAAAEGITACVIPQIHKMVGIR